MSIKTKPLALIAQASFALVLAGCATPDVENTAPGVAENSAGERTSSVDQPPAAATETNTAQVRRFSRFEFSSPSDWRMGMLNDNPDEGLVSTFSADGLAHLSVAHSQAKQDVETALQDYLRLVPQIYPNASSAPLASFGRYSSGVGRRLISRIQAGSDGAVRAMQVDLYFVIVGGQLFRLERMLPVDATPTLRKQLEWVTEQLELR